MLPSELSTSPPRTQVRHVFRPSPYYVYIQFKVTPDPPVTDPSSQFYVLADGASDQPTLTRKIQNNQLQLYSAAWLTKTLTYVYYYGGFPPIPLGWPLRLLPRYDPIPWYEYLSPRPLMPSFLNSAGTAVDVYVDRPISTGSTNPADWLVYASGLPYQPFSVEIMNTWIRLSHIQYLLKHVERVIYTRRTVPYVAADSGELDSFDLNYPYPP